MRIVITERCVPTVLLHLVRKSYVSTTSSRDILAQFEGYTYSQYPPVAAESTRLICVLLKNGLQRSAEGTGEDVASE